MARKLSRQERRIAKTIQRKYYSQPDKRPDWHKYAHEEIDWTIGLMRVSFINQRWRQNIRMTRDWSWLSRDDVDLALDPPNRNGHRYISCVFHEERTPSLWLHQDGGYYCFGCQASGDIVDLAIHLHGLNTVRDVKNFFKLDPAKPKIRTVASQPPQS